MLRAVISGGLDCSLLNWDFAAGRVLHSRQAGEGRVRQSPENVGAAHCGHTASSGPAPAACFTVLQNV